MRIEVEEEKQYGECDPACRAETLGVSLYSLEVPELDTYRLMKKHLTKMKHKLMSNTASGKKLTISKKRDL